MCVCVGGGGAGWEQGKPGKSREGWGGGWEGVGRNQDCTSLTKVAVFDERRMDCQRNWKLISVFGSTAAITISAGIGWYRKQETVAQRKQGWKRFHAN